MKSFRLSLMIFVSILTINNIIQSQEYPMPVSGHLTFTTCSGTLYDDGGLSGNYSDNATGEITLYPDSADSRIYLTFDHCDIEAAGDTIYIFNGVSEDSPWIGSYTQTPLPAYSTDESGALTIRFSTDNSLNKQGFSASISCISDTASADLKIKSVDLIPPYLCPGRIAGIYSQFSNYGVVIAKDVTIGYYLSSDSIPDSTDLLLGTDFISYLNTESDGSILFTPYIPLNTTSGNKYVIVKIDNDDQFTEDNENDNVAIIPVQVRQSVKDLYLYQAGIDAGQEIAVGGNMSFRAYIRNTGEDIIDTFNTDFYLSADTLLDAADTLIKSVQRNNLYAGQTYYIATNASLPDNISVGTMYLIVYTDFQDKIDETDETNNMAVLSFETVPKRADLSFDDVNIEPGILYSNISNNLTCYLRSTGNYIISDLYTGFYLSKDETLDSSDVLIYTSHMENIYYNSTHHAYVDLVFDNPDNIGNGLYYLMIKADSPEQITEENENNNIYYLPVLVTKYITDFEIKSLDKIQGALTLNNSLTVKFEFRNNSNMRVNRFPTYFYLSEDTVLNIPDDSLPNPSDDIFLDYYYIYSIEPSSIYSGSYSVHLRDSVPLGNYYLFAVADPENTLNDSDTSDNIKFVPVSVDEAKTDLEMVSIYLPVNKFKTSQSLYVNTRIRNSGNNYIINASIGCYLSSDSIYDPLDRHIRTEYVYDLYPGDSIDEPVYFTVPSDLPEGDYYLLMFADNYNNINELSETNNMIYKNITIDNTLYNDPDPELSLSGCYLSKSIVAAGSSLFFKGNAINMGSAVSNIRLAYYLSTDSMLNIEDLNHRLYETSIYSMNPGYLNTFSNSLILPQTCDPGKYFIIAKIDDYNVVSENNEENNLSILPVQIIEPTLDLYIDYYYQNFTILFKGVSEVISLNIHNQGSSNSQSFEVGYYLLSDTGTEGQEILLGTKQVSQLPANSSQYIYLDVQIPDSIPEGLYYLKIKVDDQDAVKETDETNNGMESIVGVMKSDIDFRIDQIVSGSPTIIPGNTCEIIYKIYNDGATRSGTTKVSYFLSTDSVFNPETDQLIAEENISGMSGKSLYNIYDYIQIPVNAETGQYRLFLVVDYQNLVTEKLETNNVSYIDFVIYPPFVDLVVENLSTDKNIMSRGEQIYVTFRIRNIGNSAAASSYVGYYLSADSILDENDEFIDEDYVYSLYSNDYSYEYNYIQINNDIDTGRYYILVIADHLKTVAESDETNNTAFEMITLVPSDVDMIISDVSVGNPVLPTGLSTSISYTLFNAGTTECPKTNTMLYLSSDTILDPLMDTYLGNYSNSIIEGGYSISRNVSVSIPLTMKKGTYYLFAVADLFNEVDETNETNNTIRLTVNLTESYVDLVITDATIQGNVFHPGDYTQITLYVRNLGNYESNSGYLSIYLSDDSVYSSNDILIKDYYYGYVSANNYRYINTSFYIPDATGISECYIIVLADKDNNTPEKNENNNSFALPVYFENDWKTDLKSGWSMHIGYEYYTGDTINCDFYFIHTNADTTSSFTVGYYLSADEYPDYSDYFFFESKITGPFADTILSENVKLVIPDTIVPGFYKILEVLDPYNVIEEASEDNNIYYVPINLLARPHTSNLSEERTNTTILYPNPASSCLYILNMDNFKYISIINSSGMLVMNDRIQKDLNMIDISFLFPGHYTIILYGEGKSEILRFFKIRE